MGEHAAVVVDIQVVLPYVVQETFTGKGAVGQLFDKREVEDGVVD